MAGEKITQEEMIAMFGETMPMEAVQLAWNADGTKTIGEIRDELRAIAARRNPLGDKFEPFASDREKRLAWFAQEVLAMCIDGLDLEQTSVVHLAERAGLVWWDECRKDNEDDWPEECELGDQMWCIKRGQLPAGVIKID